MNRESAIKELKAVYEILSDDIEEIRKYGIKNDNGFSQRTYFAFIEGMIFQLRQVALVTGKECPTLFSEQELCLLKEERYQLNAKGQLLIKDNFQSLLPMILFSVNCYARIHGADFSPKVNEHGWGELKGFLKIRNQLMHPKGIADLELNDQKLKTSVEAAMWFKSMLLSLINACNEADGLYKS